MARSVLSDCFAYGHVPAVLLLVVATKVCAAIGGRTELETYNVVAGKLWDIYAGGYVTTGVKSVIDDLQYTKYGGAEVYSKGYFNSKPLVVLAGQFSTGKTTLIEDLILEHTYPNSNIAVNPSTDQFTVILDGGSRREMDAMAQVETGRSVAAQMQSAFQKYDVLGDGFLQKFTLVKVSHEDAPALRHIMVLDTPGILSASDKDAKQYDLVQTWQTIATHADLIIVMFDVKSGDISDQFGRVIRHFAAVEDKVHFSFNKADALTPLELLHSHGGIMWQLGRVFEQPEAERMHFGSFHNKACNEDTAGKDACAMFARSKERLLDKLETLPLETPMIRMGGFGLLLDRLEVLARLIEYLQRQVPSFGSWITNCQNVDQARREMVSQEALEAHIARAVDVNGWRPKALPDIQRFVQQVIRAGGVCALKPVDQRHYITINSARIQLKQLYNELGHNVPRTVLERWGLKGAQPLPSGQEYSGVTDMKSDL